MLKVNYAVWGATVKGIQTQAVGNDVSSTLTQLLNASGGTGIVTFDIANFPNLPPGNLKHFGASVNRDGTNYFFACHEGQSIDFNNGGTAASASPYQVSFAVYGALIKGNESNAVAFDVSGVVQSFLNRNLTVIAINDNTFGDPTSGDLKQFAAQVIRNGTTFNFACQENQSIDFSTGGNPS